MQIFAFGAPCRTSLKVYRTSVNQITGGVSEVSLFSSVVENINVGDLTHFNSNHSTLNNIEYLSWSRNGKIMNTIIKNVTFIEATNLEIEDGFMEEFKRFTFFSSGVYLQVRDSSINSIDSYSWIVETDEFIMENVEISTVKRLGLIVMSKVVTLRNVSIMMSESPFISVHVDSIVTFESVKINGEEVFADGPMVSSRIHPFLRIDVDEETEYCKADGNTLLTCDFKEIPKVRIILQ